MKRAAADENKRLHEEEMARRAELNESYYDALDVLLDAKSKELDAIADAEDAAVTCCFRSY